jgi:uncharacterized protein (DUF2345 family)
MTTDTWESAEVSARRNMGTGIYKAIVVGHVDPSYMGTLRVCLLKEQGNNKFDIKQQYSVKCATPFYGATDFNFQGENTAAKTDAQTGFDDTQKSYGMWFVPPDVGVTVLCMFANGEPDDGFWVACVPDKFANHMIPAIGGSLELDISEADKKKYSTDMPLPVGEINRVVNDLKNSTKVEKIPKPVHPIADKFLQQGLLEDDCRGTSPSNARRNLPNMVFGISTPGPLDQKGKKKTIGDSPKPIPVSRLGGTQIVMDDGDDQYVRKTPAGEGGVEYADTLNGEKGQDNIPYSEYFRIRTRTGHQLLFHNSEDLIYIGNAKGTTWIELTSNGKIDIFADDSISIHTQNDLNIRADRDINLEAGRNINMAATGQYKSSTNLYGTPTTGSDGIVRDEANRESGRIHLEAAGNYNLLVGKNGTILVNGNSDEVVLQDKKITVQGGYDLKVGKDTKITTAGNTDVKSGKNYTEQAARIDMNGPKAIDAVEAKVAQPLNRRENFINDTKIGWEKKYQSKETLSSIMRRVPMHEPWLGHENFAPNIWTKQNTDRDFD